MKTILWLNIPVETGNMQFSFIRRHYLNFNWQSMYAIQKIGFISESWAIFFNSFEFYFALCQLTQSVLPLPFRNYNDCIVLCVEQHRSPNPTFCHKFFRDFDIWRTFFFAHCSSHKIRFQCLGHDHELCIFSQNKWPMENFRKLH